MFFQFKSKYCMFPLFFIWSFVVQKITKEITCLSSKNRNCCRPQFEYLEALLSKCLFISVTFRLKMQPNDGSFETKMGVFSITLWTVVLMILLFSVFLSKVFIFFTKFTTYDLFRRLLFQSIIRLTNLFNGLFWCKNLQLKLSAWKTNRSIVIPSTSSLLNIGKGFNQCSYLELNYFNNSCT